MSDSFTFTRYDIFFIGGEQNGTWTKKTWIGYTIGNIFCAKYNLIEILFYFMFVYRTKIVFWSTGRITYGAKIS